MGKENISLGQASNHKITNTFKIWPVIITITIVMSLFWEVAFRELENQLPINKDLYPFISSFWKSLKNLTVTPIITDFFTFAVG
jgi:hypothetical protein